MTINVNNIIAFVTGANRGVGRAITEGLLEAGANKVYTAVRNLASVNELQEKYGNRIVPIEVAKVYSPYAKDVLQIAQ